MDETEQKRTGETVITSVSVSKEFAEAIKTNNLSPTQIFRKGAVIEFYERNIKVAGQTQTGELFKQRYQKFKELFQNEEINLFEETLQKTIISIQNMLNELKKVKEVKNG